MNNITLEQIREVIDVMNSTTKKKQTDNLNLDFFFDKDDGQYKVVAFRDNGIIIKLHTITKEQVNHELNRETEYLMQEEE